ncbi:MAG TPA: hypothetical protein VG900_09285 [Hyphomicrobiaceae bacterium]|nr:hypothetical protein [Hyphomicrobiaceae bacterium]
MVFVRAVLVVFGLALACLAAGLTLVLFVYTPAELVTLPRDVAADRLSEVGMLTLAAATHCAVFAGPLGLLAALIGEIRKIGSWTYYTIAGIAIAVLGFLAQHWSENANEPTILNNYALIAFLTTGFVAGFVYWLVSGRSARAPPPPPLSSAAAASA